MLKSLTIQHKILNSSFNESKRYVFPTGFLSYRQTHSHPSNHDLYQEFKNIPLFITHNIIII